MKKILLVTHVSGFIPQFEMNNVHILQKMGYEIHYASNFHNPSYGKDNHRLDGTGIIKHQIDFVRSPFKIIKNIKAYRQLYKLINEQDFDLIHCHTPMGGVLTRLVARAIHICPIIYTAHGFHFYQGAPLKNWIFYFPIEWYLSYYTTLQICINREDYGFATKYFKAKGVMYIPGVGIDLEKIRKYTEDEKKEIRKRMGIKDESKILISSGELIPRKNHKTLIYAIKELHDQYERQKLDKKIEYWICGQGELQSALEKLIKTLGAEEYIKLLGYRNDILELLQLADGYIFPSYQEGLPMGLLEAMASYLPIVCSNIRGNEDLQIEKKTYNKKPTLIETQGGYLVYPPDNKRAYIVAIKKIIDLTEEKKHIYGEWNRRRAKKFSLEQVNYKMEYIYSYLTK